MTNLDYNNKNTNNSCEIPITIKKEAIYCIIVVKVVNINDNKAKGDILARTELSS